MEKTLAMAPPIGKLVQHIIGQQIKMKINRKAVFGGPVSFNEAQLWHVLPVWVSI